MNELVEHKIITSVRAVVEECWSVMAPLSASDDELLGIVDDGSGELLGHKPVVIIATTRSFKETLSRDEDNK